MNNDTAKDVEKGFAAMGGAFKIAADKRNADLLLKQGYLGFKNPTAIAAFHSNPEYASWSCEVINGEYRFRPPEKATVEKQNEIKNEESVTEKSLNGNNDLLQKNQMPNLIDDYKRIKATNSNVLAYFNLKQDGTNLCDYKVVSIDSKLNQKEEQALTIPFDEHFVMTTIPSIYNAMIDGIPAEDHEKGEGAINNYSLINALNSNSGMFFW